MRIVKGIALILLPGVAGFLLAGWYYEVGLQPNVITGLVLWIALLLAALWGTRKAAPLLVGRTWNIGRWVIYGVYCLFVLSVVTTAAGEVTYTAKARAADECIARFMQEKTGRMAGNQITAYCFEEANLSESDIQKMTLSTLSQADAMTVPQRIEWCKTYLPHFWQEAESLDAACVYAAANWNKVKNDLLKQMQ